MSYLGVVLADSPVFYWRLDETSGTNAADQQAANAGTYTGAVTLNQGGALTVSGDPDAAIALDGATGYVFTASALSGPAAPPLSIEAWFKTTSATVQPIVSFNDSQTGAITFNTPDLFVDSAGKVNFRIWTGSEQLVTSTRAYNDGNWHHVVAVLAANNNMALYVDGASVGSSANTAAQSFGSPTGYWRLGLGRPTGSDLYFAGSLDEVAVYSTALSTAQVLAHYNAGNPWAPGVRARLPRRLGPKAAGPTFFAARQPQQQPYPPAGPPGLSVVRAQLPRRVGPKAVGSTFFADRQRPLIAVPVGTVPSAGAIAAATAILTASPLLSPTATSTSTATATVTAAQLLSPSATSKSAASATVTAAQLLSPNASSKSSATATVTASQLIVPVAASSSTATVTVTAAPRLSPTAISSSAASATVTVPAGNPVFIVPVAASSGAAGALATAPALLAAAATSVAATTGAVDTFTPPKPIFVKRKNLYYVDYANWVRGP